MDTTWAHDVMRIREIVRRVGPGTALDPRVLAQMVGLSLGHVIALLQFLVRNREGRLELRVVDSRGIELASYRSLPDVPAVVTDAFGDRVEVGPENVELVFRVTE